MKPKIDYKELWAYIKSGYKTKEITEAHGVSDATVSACRAIGTALVDNANDSVESIKKYTPRQLMERLAELGYRGKLEYVQTVDLSKL